MSSEPSMVHTPPLKAIKAFCKCCSGNSSKELRLCPTDSCPLHPFRFGNNPYRKKRSFSSDEKKQIAERLHAGRKRKIDLTEYCEQEL